MSLGVIVGIAAFIVMSLIAVIIGIVSAVSTISGFDNPAEKDEDA